jgi:acyl carrier protein
MSLREDFRRRSRPAERAAVLTEYLQGELQRALSLPAPPDPDAGFFDLGIDSTTAVDLLGRLGEQLGCTLSATALFDHPTVGRLAAHLASEGVGTGFPEAIPPESVSPLPAEIDRWLGRLSETELDSLLDDRLNTFFSRNGVES